VTVEDDRFPIAERLRQKRVDSWFEKLPTFKPASS